MGGISVVPAVVFFVVLYGSNNMESVAKYILLARGNAYLLFSGVVLKVQTFDLGLPFRFGYFRYYSTLSVGEFISRPGCAGLP